MAMFVYLVLTALVHGFATAARFRSNAETIPGVEKVSIMEPQQAVLDCSWVPLSDLGPVGTNLSLHNGLLRII